jgi:SNF2 family DNA or RNA helicase
VAAFSPHPYQRYCADRLLSEKRLGLLLEMGLGKTAIVLSVLHELIRDRLEVGKCLVIAPKKVAEATWQDEARKWDDLRDLRFETVAGGREARERALARHADVYVIGRDNTEWLVDYCTTQGRRWPFDMIVCDESSSFKNPAAKRFRALCRVIDHTDRIVILTGTPAPNGVEDMWAQVYLLDRGARLGKHIKAFRDRYIDVNLYNHARTPKPGAFDAVQRLIGDICVSMHAADYLTMPPLIVDDFPVALTETARKAYKKLERDLLLSLPDAEITVLSAAALHGKLMQLCNGAVYDADHGAHEVHACKLDALAELIEGLHGEHAILFYGFQHDIPRIRKVIDPKLRVRLLASADDTAAWNRGEVDVLIAHPASCAYGLNLQAGGRHEIWFSLPASLELYQQAVARLYRQGQERPVIVHRLLVKGGVDEDTAAALEDKRGAQDALLDALKARIDRVRKEG